MKYISLFLVCFFAFIFPMICKASDYEIIFNDREINVYVPIDIEKFRQYLIFENIESFFKSLDNDEKSEFYRGKCEAYSEILSKMYIYYKYYPTLTAESLP